MLVALTPMPFAQGYVTIGGMAELKRGQDEIARQNLVYVIEACNRRLGSARGGVRYLADLLGSQETYISQVAKGYKGRTPGRQLKAKIEAKFGLDADWMDAPHAASVVEQLVPLVPSLPYQQKTRIAGSQPAYVEHLERKLAEALDRISALESQSASKSSSRK